MVAMQNSRSIRKHLTPQQREQILRDHQASRLTDKEFARQSGVAVSTLYAWRRKAATGRPASGVAFVAVPNLLSEAPASPALLKVNPCGNQRNYPRRGEFVEAPAARTELEWKFTFMLDRRLYGREKFWSKA